MLHLRRIRGFNWANTSPIAAASCPSICRPTLHAEYHRPQVQHLLACLWERKFAGSGHLDGEATGDEPVVGRSWIVAVAVAVAVAVSRFAIRAGEKQNEREYIIPVD
jgi:hypothetical protein